MWAQVALTAALAQISPTRVEMMVTVTKFPRMLPPKAVIAVGVEAHVVAVEAVTGAEVPAEVDVVKAVDVTAAVDVVVIEVDVGGPEVVPEGEVVAEEVEVVEVVQEAKDEFYTTSY